MPGDKWQLNSPKSIGCSKSSSKKKVDNDISIPQEIRKITNKQLTPKATREGITNQSQR